MMSFLQLAALLAVAGVTTAMVGHSDTYCLCQDNNIVELEIQDDIHVTCDIFEHCDTCQSNIDAPCVTCMPNRYGALCEHECVCGMGGCYDGVDGDGSCECDDGSYEIDGECQDLCARCENGLCQPEMRRCNCFPGWGGEYCDTKLFFAKDFNITMDHVDGYLMAEWSVPNFEDFHERAYMYHFAWIALDALNEDVAMNIRDDYDIEDVAAWLSSQAHKIYETRPPDAFHIDGCAFALDILEDMGFRPKSGPVASLDNEDMNTTVHDHIMNLYTDQRLFKASELKGGARMRSKLGKTTNNQLYAVKAKVLDRMGNVIKRSHPIFYRTPMGPPSAPQAPLFNGHTEDSITVSWNIPSLNGDLNVSYRLQYAIHGKNDWTVKWLNQTTTPKATVRGLSPDERYVFKVAVGNSYGFSEDSEESKPLHVKLPPTDCTRGCQGLDFCASAMAELRESMEKDWWYVTCDETYDSYARELYMTWLEKGVFTMGRNLTFEKEKGFFFLTLNRTSCDINRLKASACVLTLQPCIDEASKWQFCYSDCVYMLSQCGSMREEEAKGLCWQMNIRSDTTCFTSMSFVHMMSNLTDSTMDTYQLVRKDNADT